MRRALVLFVAVVVLGISAVAHAALISQDFDNTTTFPLGYQFTSTITELGDSATTDGLWRLGPLGGTGDYPKIVGDQFHSGDQSLHLYRRGTGTAMLEGYTTMAGTPINSGVVEATVWLRRDSGGSTTWLLANRDEFAANNGVIAAALCVCGSQLKCYTTSGWSDPADGVTLPENSWFGVRMVVDLDNDTCDVWYNGGAGWGEVLSDLTATGDGNINCMLWMPQNPYGGNIWIDDVELRVVPKPGDVDVADNRFDRPALLRMETEKETEKGTQLFFRNGPEGASHKLDLPFFSQQAAERR